MANVSKKKVRPKALMLGLGLDSDGYLSEGSGENLFLVKNGTLLTPPLVSSVLPGITRDTVVQLARRLRIPVEEARLPREMLYISDEVFMTGTAAELTPVASIDGRPMARVTGGLASRLQKAYFECVRGRDLRYARWLSHV